MLPAWAGPSPRLASSRASPDFNFTALRLPGACYSICGDSHLPWPGHLCRTQRRWDSIPADTAATDPQPGSSLRRHKAPSAGLDTGYAQTGTAMHVRCLHKALDRAANPATHEQAARCKRGQDGARRPVSPRDGWASGTVIRLGQDVKQTRSTGQLKIFEILGRNPFDRCRTGGSASAGATWRHVDCHVVGTNAVAPGATRSLGQIVSVPRS